MPKNFFSYSEDGAEFHDTAEQAKTEVERRLSDYRDDAQGEEWADEVEGLCWGQVKGHVVVTETLELCPDADCDGECGGDVHHNRSYDVEVEYGLVDLDEDLSALCAELAEVKAALAAATRRAEEAEARVAAVELRSAATPVDVAFSDELDDSLEKAQRIAKKFAVEQVAEDPVLNKAIAYLFMRMPEWVSNARTNFNACARLEAEVRDLTRRAEVAEKQVSYVCAQIESYDIRYPKRPTWTPRTPADELRLAILAALEVPNV